MQHGKLLKSDLATAIHRLHATGDACAAGHFIAAILFRQQVGDFEAVLQR